MKMTPEISRLTAELTAVNTEADAYDRETSRLVELVKAERQPAASEIWSRKSQIQHDIRKLREQAALQAAQNQDIPTGTILWEMKYMWGASRYTGRKGVLEIVKPGDRHPLNKASHRQADVGAVVVRNLRKNGERGDSYERPSVYKWTPAATAVLQNDGRVECLGSTWVTKAPPQPESEPSPF